MRLVDEAPGAHCPQGGTAIQNGVEANGNGELDPPEVTQTQYVCSGGSGPAVLVALNIEPASANCASGGTAISTGIDQNRNGLLESTETTQTRYVCNGASGTGVAALVSTTPEAAGATCATGGVLVRSGLDGNGNGILDSGEVISTGVVCNGPRGDGGPAGPTALVRASVETAGVNCALGGTRLIAGTDLNADSVLDPAEVTSTSYVCNGATGSTGPVGSPGREALVRADPEPMGLNCAQGGAVVRAGADANSNGALETAEVTSTTYVCQGLPGSMGTSGLTSLVKLDAEPAGSNCQFGGSTARTGLDLNRNGTLETGEVTSTTYFCTQPAVFSTGWSASTLNPPDVYEVGNFQLPTGRKARIYKVRDDTLLKVTVTDNLRVGHLAPSNAAAIGYYGVRINSSQTDCFTGAQVYTNAGGPLNFHTPFADTCLVQAPAGYYELESWVGQTSAGTTYVGWGSGDDQLLVEELTDTRYAWVRSAATSTAASTVSTVPVAAPGRSVSYTKQAANTWLKVTLADTLRGTNSTSGEGIVSIRMDGAPTTCSGAQLF